MRTRLGTTLVVAFICLCGGTAFAIPYAVIFNGGGYDWTWNYWPFYNETKRVYTTLLEDYGYAEENIYVLQSDGLSTGNDRMYLDENGDRSPRNSPIDIDGDGDTDVNGPGTQTALLNALTALSGTMTADDFFLFVGIDHGAKDGNSQTDHQYLVPWHYGSGWDDFVQDAELDAWCDAYIPAANQVYVFGQCYSGGFINDMQQPGRIIFTSSEYNKVSYCDAMEPSGDEDYMGYVRAWWQAIDLDENGDPDPEADTDGDGRVAMDEAWLYSLTHDPFYQHPDYPETPQFSDLGGLSPILDIYGNAPEPGTLLLFGVGIGGLLWWRRRTR